jgi:hypothetical protein
MPQPTLEQIAPNGVVQLDTAPAKFDEATFDELFPAEPNQTVIAPVQQTQPRQEPAAPVTPGVTPPVTQDPNKFFLKGDRSVYETLEAATKGVNEKDALIETLRQRFALTTGIDPLTGKPVALNGQPQPEVIDYSQRPDAYLEDLYKAAKTGTPEAYRDVQQKFIFDSVKPLQPILQKAARDQATEALVHELPTAKDFVGTPAYHAALDANPELKQAVNVGETDHRFHSRLPGLYKLAFLTAQGMQLPELLKAQAAQPKTQTQQVTQTPPVRTTVQPTTPGVGTPTAPPSFKSIEGIRAIIRDSEARGMTLGW